MTGIAEHIRGTTFHGRQAEGVENAFRYGIDYVLIDPDDTGALPRLFSRNRFNLASLRDRDHGGPPGQGTGAPWVRQVLAEALPDFTPARLLLLAQPRVLGHVFNPVSFWLIHDVDDVLRVVVAEVTNTYGDRHSYLCHTDDLAPLTRETTVRAQKLMHVSPFQPVQGDYTFRFDIDDRRIGIWIDYRMGNGRLLATLTGHRQPLTSPGLIGAALRRPFGARRVLALIHWQALKLWWKGASFRPRPTPPAKDISR
ncbi:DUF1365 domain-containing protein [Jannaschia pohangensis]|uniref:Cyclopropane-fatty-acyl-phospholipid synthase n=1 Tax=Jannaschia pohangensis TaxID=390807 RepID=A0A1I3Q287_9RHOB|nr:DUF1365 domain-containing protein [Jannaschia pohangensis]SFJ27561.1 hypothetical protein SAMN04488095_2381 [Jannaschia pohangensis]